MRRCLAACAFLLLALVLIAGACGRSPGSTAPQGRRRAARPFAGRARIEVDTASASVSNRGPTALDGLSRPELARFRRQRVLAHAELNLFPADYEPYEGTGSRIWASLNPGVRWLGPTAYYVANPYLLVVPTCANHVTPLGLFCPDFEVSYENGVLEEVHRGRDARCWLDRLHEQPYADHPGQLRVMTVNATDAGLSHARVDLGRSENVAAGDGPGNIARVAHAASSFFHVGRYGANNISPEDPDAWVRLVSPRLRTVVTVELWREAPSPASTPAEVVYRVIVDPALP